MDLFSDFSFENTSSSRRHPSYDDLGMEDVSPYSSRSSSPSLQSPMEANLQRRISMAELAAHFEHHALDQNIPSHKPSPLFGRLQNPSSRRAAQLSPVEDFSHIRRTRQSGTRNLCSSHRLASIETLVDRMMKDGSSCLASLHPSSGSSGPKLNEITSAPMFRPLSSGTISDLGTSEEDSEDENADEPSIISSRPSSTRIGVGLSAASRRSGIEKPRRKLPPARR